jgi:Na+/proline symporter
MLGLIIAAMFSATMANLSSHFNVRASVLTNDVYRRLVRPHAREKELVMAGRGMTILVGGLTVLLGLYLARASANELFKYMVTLFGAVVAPMGIPMLLGICSKRVNARSATTAVIGGIILSALLIGPPDFLASLLGDTVTRVLRRIAMAETGTLWGIHWEKETAIFFISTVFTLSVMFGVSAITPMRREEQERVALFQRRLATPVGELPEEQAERAAAKPDETAMSPFGVVGICVLLIGLLMLVIQPWLFTAGHELANWLNLGIALLLVVIGGSMSWLSRQARARERSEGSTE